MWVQLLELPLELFDEEVLFAIENTIGRTVKIDDTTLTVQRGRFARICVEINFGTPLTPFVTVLGCQQRVEYECLLLICFGCGMYGNRSNECPNRREQIIRNPDWGR